MRLVAIVLLLILDLSFAAADDTAGERAGAWTETKWPFLIDQWGLGNAYQCKAADCGVEITRLPARQGRVLQLHHRHRGG